MADASDIAVVRANTASPDNVDPFTDEFVSDLIDALGVAGASAAIWRQKAASYVTMTDVTEAGASHKFTDLHKNALAMAAAYDKQVVGEVETEDVVRVNEIVRET